jgi:hypothetical protein
MGSGVKKVVKERLATVPRVVGDRRGSIAIISAVTFPVVVMLIGGTIDFATIMHQRGVLQAATDAAALSTAKQLSLTDSQKSNLAAVGRAVVTGYVKENSASAKSSSNVNVTTTVKNDPLEVSVASRQTVETFFKNGFGFLPREIEAHATARVVGKPNICLLALAPKENGAISLEQSAEVTGRECAVFSNSTHSIGIKAKDTAKLTASMICSAGGVQDTAVTMTPAPLYDCPQFGDPLAGRPEPVVGACQAGPIVIEANTQLTPGTYCGGLEIRNGATVTFAPGTYVMKDGPLRVVDGGSITGKDVGFFLTGKNAELILDPKSAVNLEAPTQGTMAGLLFFAARASSGKSQHKILSENAQNLVGTIYIPTGELRIDGAAKVGAEAAYTAIVAEKVRLYGGPHIILNSRYEETDVPVPAGIKGAGQPIALVN